MLHFKQYFYLNESKEEKTLALELAGHQNILNDLNEEIPQGRKDTDKLLLLAAYYYSQVGNLKQLKKDLKDYIELLNKNKMPLITVDLKTKKPNKDYLTWINEIHGHQGEEQFKQAKKFIPSDFDFQNEQPIMTSPDGKIKVYEANSAQQCIVLGRGQNFCISQPGNSAWKSYRDKSNSTFYFVYDYSRNDELGIVVIDKNNYGTELTDKRNTTGTTKDPFTGEYTEDPTSYLEYLEKNGIDTHNIKNKPKTDEEIEEDEKLGSPEGWIYWFVSLSPVEKANYIGRGHLLTDEQFDYLWNNKFLTLLEKYVKTGLKLTDYQIDKIFENSDLRKNYLHNRALNIEGTGHWTDVSKKEMDAFNYQQKDKIYTGIANNGQLSKDDMDFLPEKYKDIAATGKNATRFFMNFLWSFDKNVLENIIDKYPNLNKEFENIDPSFLAAFLSHRDDTLKKEKINFIKWLVEKKVPFDDDLIKQIYHKIKHHGTISMARGKTITLNHEQKSERLLMLNDLLKFMLDHTKEPFSLDNNDQESYVFWRLLPKETQDIIKNHPNAVTPKEYVPKPKERTVF